MTNKQVEFDETLETTDYGFIVCGKTGKLKGLWIPQGQEDSMVPEVIVDICIDMFGIDPKEFSNDNHVFH